ncbi:macrophage colony-stimulating factor 1a [Salminus brasiliensis]|uniref:macrophage colony-stimulating factor 1a n=1 Tax=Salminus brasiliensis TaxID=930266 RepID=UPI003B82DBB0
MNTNTPAHKAKIRHLCCFLVLCLHLAYGAVPGPCKHSVTKDHLLYLRRLIGNQLQNGCSITYNFTERRSLSEVCYIKAALPHVLDLLNTHFRYGRDSDNYNYTSLLKNSIYNIYSQKCILPINEEIEDNPVKFAKLYITSPRVGLEKAEEVIQMYKGLVTTNDKPIEWNCEDEYADDLPDSTTTLLTQTSGTQECQCPCTKISSTFLKASMLTRSSTTSSPTTSSPSRPSLAPVLRHKKDGYRYRGTPNSEKTQPSPVSLDSETAEPSPGQHSRTELSRNEPYSSTTGDFTDLILSPNPHYLDAPMEMESSPTSVVSSTIKPSTEFLRMPQRRTALAVQSTTSRPSQRNSAPLSSGRSTVRVLAKRSLDSKVQGILSDFYSELLKRWITSSTSDPAGIHEKVSHLRITPGATTNSPFQTLHVDRKTASESTTAPPSSNITEDITENLSPPAEQSVGVSTPTHIQTHLHMAPSLPENVIKAISEGTDYKGSECQKDTEATQDQVSRHGEEEHWGVNFQLASSSLKMTFLITSVCFVLLLLTALVFSKPQMNIRQLLQRPRRTKTRRSGIYNKIQL